ncbi:CCHC-type domain-containing protein [Trichonephila clavipes]|nr:CCHC-type domain-containing protein [Trichonephila clavipes]
MSPATHSYLDQQSSTTWRKEEAKQGRGKYPECTVQKLMSSFYVDNCLVSVQTQSELDRFIDVATEIMAERKFDLRGWEHSNPSDPIASPTNVLVMIWERHCDTLSLNIPHLRELMEEYPHKEIIVMDTVLVLAISQEAENLFFNLSPPNNTAKSTIGWLNLGAK